MSFKMLSWQYFRIFFLWSVALLFASAFYANALEDYKTQSQAWDVNFQNISERIDEAYLNVEAFEAMRGTLVDILRQIGARSEDLESERNELLELLGVDIGHIDSDPNILKDILSEDSDLARQYKDVEDALTNVQSARNRAEALISEVDAKAQEVVIAIYSQRQIRPFSLTTWQTAISDITTTITGALTKFVDRLSNTESRAQIFNSAFLDAALFLLALVILVFSSRYVSNVAHALQRSQHRYTASFGKLLEEYTPYCLWIFAIILMERALTNAILNSLVFVGAIQLLRYIGIAFVIGLWLGRARPQSLKIRLALSLSILAALYDLSNFADHYMWSIETLGIVLIVLIPVFVISFLPFFKYQPQFFAQVALSKRFSQSLYILLQRIIIFVSVVCFILALAGYTALSSAVFIPIFAGYVFALILMQLYEDLKALLIAMLPSSQVKTAFWPLLLAAALMCLFFFGFMLLWGVSTSYLQELWIRFIEGITVGSVHISPQIFFRFVLIFSIGYLLVGFAQRLLKDIILPRTSWNIGAQNAVTSLSGYAGYTIAALFALSTSGINLSSIAVVLGALSVGIGFGLQNIVSNFVSGIILLIERPFKRGDWISVNGQDGYVKSISVRATEVETFDNATLIVPNADFISGTVVNWVHSSNVARIKLPIGVSYDSDPEKIIEILLAVAEESVYKSDYPWGPRAYFLGFGDSALNFELRFFVKNADDMLSAISDANVHILQKMRAHNIEIPFPKRDITIVHQ